MSKQYSLFEAVGPACSIEMEIGAACPTNPHLEAFELPDDVVAQYLYARSAWVEINHHLWELLTDRLAEKKKGGSMR